MCVINCCNEFKKLFPYLTIRWKAVKYRLKNDLNVHY